MAAAVLSPRRFIVLQAASRCFSTSNSDLARFRANTPPQVKPIGTLDVARVDGAYPSGQMFIHRVFAYKGIIICSFNCPLHEKKRGISVYGRSSDLPVKEPRENLYQVLIDKGDWPHMRFPVDMTTYLGEGSPRGERLLTFINGMDCVLHEDVIPFTATERTPVEHDLFDRLFLLAADSIRGQEGSEMRFETKPELMQNYMASQRSWLAPQDVYREVTEGIEVTVITFYLGPNMIGGQKKHCWRYSVRIRNLENTTVVLRERSLKVFSLNNMNQVNGQGVVGTQPELSPRTPAFQFSSTVDLPQPKGGHMWGKFKMERENGALFEVTIPTFVLENHPDLADDVAEKVGE